MLNFFRNYKFSFILALAFHIILFSLILVNWHSETRQSKKIVLKQGDVIKATTVSSQQLEKKKQQLDDRNKQLELQQERKKQEELKRKQELEKQAEIKRKKALEKKRAERKRKQELEKKAEQKRKAELKLKEEKRKKELQKKEADRKRKEKLEKEKLRKEKLEKERKRKEAERKEAEKRRIEQERKRQQEIEAEAARLEADRIRREKGIVSRYAKLIQNKITRYWRRPANVASKMKCTLNIRMTPDGEVVSVKVIRSSGNFSFDRAAEKAVTGASPLPVPTDQALFEKDFRNLTINYEK